MPKKIKSDKVNYISIGLTIVIVLALFLRLYRIGDLTEFLGDQGRTSIVMYEWLKGGSLPLAGPTTLTNAHLGPIFYYILAPGYLMGNFNPVIVSVWLALLGVLAVALLYNGFGFIPAALLAVAPAIVRQDRIIWEPNLVPLFSILFGLSVIKKQYFWLGVVTSILVQLHYPNIFFIALSGLVLVYCRNIKFWFLWMIGFFACLAPFLIYELQNNFSDLANIASVIGGSGLGKKQTILFAFDYAHRVFGLIIPFMTIPIAGLLMIGWLIFLGTSRRLLHIFWAIWFFIGLLAMARYSGVVHDHYLLFLLAPVLFTLASIKGKIFYIFVGIIVLMNISKTDIFMVGNKDIARTREAVEHVLKDKGVNSFSFTLINSRSFSDLHYRYFFLVNNQLPTSITSEFSNLYIICDGNSCRIPQDHVSVLCYDFHCSGEYPNISLINWQFTELLPTNYAQIYKFVYNRK